MKKFFRGAEAYGSTQSTAEPAPDKRDWESLGNIRHLCLELATTMGKQFVALAMVIVQIYYSEKLLMDCNVDTLTAVGCEYTKAYVVCFPLLAFVAALIVASRLILEQRMYYQLLKKEIILGFHKISPAKDPLFLVLSWCLGNACLHFVLELCVKDPITRDTMKTVFIANEDQLHVEIHRVVVFYVLPCVVFMAFLWNAYDTEARLVPLSKFFEDDAEEARQILSCMQYVPESVAAHVVTMKLIHFRDAAGKPCTIDEVCDQLVQHCSLHGESSISLNPESTFESGEGARPSPSGTGKSTRSSSGAGSATNALMRLSHAAMTETANMTDMSAGQGKALQQYSQWYLVSEMWPGRVLLDSRLADDPSWEFRQFWGAGCILLALSVLSIITLFGYQIFDDFAGIERGHYANVASLFVHLAHAFLALYLGVAFLRESWGPLISRHSRAEAENLRHRSD